MDNKLARYLDRIGFNDDGAPTLACLRAVHHAHLLNIPYENLDIHLGRALVLDEDAIFDKLVAQKRGGWCYEMNALLAWALRAIGFAVQLLGTQAALDGQSTTMSLDHAIVLVALDEPYLADVGLGNGPREPLPLRAGAHVQGPLTFQLEQTHGQWRLCNPRPNSYSFTFDLQPRALGDFAPACTHLQTSSDSQFVKVTLGHRFTPDGVYSLRGLMLRYHDDDANTVDERIIGALDDFAVTLRDVFGLDLSEQEINHLWPRVWARHRAWVEEHKGAS